MAAPSRADTPNDVHKQARPDIAGLKIKLSGPWLSGKSRDTADFIWV